ncbi:Hypothetical predicted protein, partial [Pelobates cultripes]
MAQQKTKKSTNKAEKLNFFGNKAQTKQNTQRALMQDGDACREDLDTPALTESDPDRITKSYLQTALDMLSQKLI